MNGEEHCKVCRFYRVRSDRDGPQDDGWFGHCVRFPPWFKEKDSCVDGWPFVHGQHWCGEFKPTRTSSANSDEFASQSMVVSAIDILRRRQEPLTNRELMKALMAGGWHSDSAQPLNVIGVVMRRRFETVGDVVSVGRGTWALAEWSEIQEESA